LQKLKNKELRRKNKLKRFLQIALLVATGLSLSACGNLKNSDLANNPTTSTTKKKSYQTTSTNKNGYNVLLKDGEYVTSPIEGTTENTSDNNVDGRALESGLINLSQNTFSSSKYVFQEGQKISVADATDWLGRKSKSNADGLNAEKSTKKDSYNPIILDQILEQDFLTKSNSSYKMGGMSVGLALNSVDYYQKVKDGPQYHKDISRAEQETFGKEAANKLVSYLRKKKGLKDIPILVGLFSKTSKDSLVGGNYFAYGIANANSSKTGGSEKAINSTDAASFSDFKAAIQGYFPNISGVTATVRYQNKTLTQMNITVTTQFFGYAQIESFSRLVLSAAKKYLPKDAPIEIKINSVNDTQALIAKNSADDSYYVHVFGGE